VQLKNIVHIAGRHVILYTALDYYSTDTGILNSFWPKTLVPLSGKKFIQKYKYWKIQLLQIH